MPVRYQSPPPAQIHGTPTECPPVQKAPRDRSMFCGPAFTSNGGTNVSPTRQELLYDPNRLVPSTPVKEGRH